MPNLQSERLQANVSPETKAKIHYAALLSRPQTTMGALASFLVEEGIERYISKLPDLDQRRIALRLRALQDEQDEAEEDSDES